MEIWGFVIIGGPILLAAAVAWALARSRKADKEIDPATPADDPAKGMK